jgi:hypothetical protein
LSASDSDGWDKAQIKESNAQIKKILVLKIKEWKRAQNTVITSQQMPLSVLDSLSFLLNQLLKKPLLSPQNAVAWKAQ